MEFFKSEKKIIKNTKEKYKEAAETLKEGSEKIKQEFSQENMSALMNEDYSKSNNDNMKKILDIKNTILWVICILCIAIILNSKFAFSVVNGLSMYSTYNDGEILLSHRTQDVKKGDVIVFTADPELFPGSKETILKRVIATPGDTIEIRNNSVFVNGKVIDEPYAQGVTSDYAKETVKENHVFVLGDNREISKDSRMVGQIPTELIIGVVDKKIL